MTFRPRTRRLAALTIATVAVVYASGAAGQWAWKEDSGRIVYSDRPPPANVKSTQILRQPSLAAPTPAPAPQAAAPGAAATDGDRQTAAPAASAPKSIAERDMEFRKRQQERADSERKAQEEQQKSAAKAAECERARGYLRSLDDGVRISRTDASGNREYLDDAQRAAESERTRKAIQQLCN
ncbi:MAG TPA: DUF4124 domain-containing protein [Burkholderiaceae bacterium]|nr:DUF4124 domain-containing protein [Burkholderiaceae bacterium]